MTNTLGTGMAALLFGFNVMMLAKGYYQAVFAVAMAGGFLVVLWFKLIRPSTFRHWERLLDQLHFTRVDRRDLPGPLSSSFWLSRAGRLSSFYRHPTERMRCVALPTRDSGRSWGSSPDSVVFVAERRSSEEIDVLALPRTNPVFQVVEWSGFLASLHSWGRRDVIFYGKERPSDELMERIADVLDRLDRTRTTIELSGQYAALTLRDVPPARDVVRDLPPTHPGQDPLETVRELLESLDERGR